MSEEVSSISPKTEQLNLNIMSELRLYTILQVYTVLWRKLRNVEINFLLFYRMMKNYTVEYLSGVFCFVQTSDGKVVSVFHPRTEDAKVTNFKKGIASAFQTNFKGTGEEIEIDPQSRHSSHYR